MENWLEYVKTKYVVTDIADDSIVYETVVEGDIRNVIMPSDIIRSRKDYRLSIYLETDDDRINSKLANKLLASLIWNSSALKLSSDDGINLGDLITADTFQTVINNIYNQLNDIDLTQFYNKQEAHEHFVEDVVHVGNTPPDDDNMLWYDTSAGGYQLSDDMLMTMKGTVATKNNLPSTGMVNGDVWKVTNEGAFYVFNKNQWEIFSGDKTVIIAQNDEPDNKNVIWYDLDDDTQSIMDIASLARLDGDLAFKIEYHMLNDSYNNVKNKIKDAFNRLAIEVPLIVRQDIDQTTYDKKGNLKIPFISSISFNDVDLSSLTKNSFMDGTVFKEITKRVPVSLTFFDSSKKSIDIMLNLWYNPLLDTQRNYPNRIEVDAIDLDIPWFQNGAKFIGTVSWYGPEIVLGVTPEGVEKIYRNKIEIPLMSPEMYKEKMINNPDTDLFRIAELFKIDVFQGYENTVENDMLSIYIPHMSYDNYTALDYHTDFTDWGADKWSAPINLDNVYVEIIPVIDGVPDRLKKVNKIVQRNRNDSSIFTGAYYNYYDLHKVNYYEFFKTYENIEGEPKHYRKFWTFLQYNRTTNQMKNYVRNGNSHFLKYQDYYTTIFPPKHAGTFLIFKAHEYDSSNVLTRRWMSEVHPSNFNYPEVYANNSGINGDSSRFDLFKFRDNGTVGNILFSYPDNSGQSAGSFINTFSMPVFDSNGSNRNNKIMVSILFSRAYTTTLPSNTRPPTHTNGWDYTTDYEGRTLPQFIQVTTDILDQFGIEYPERVL